MYCLIVGSSGLHWKVAMWDTDTEHAMFVEDHLIKQGVMYKDAITTFALWWCMTTVSYK